MVTDRRFRVLSEIEAHPVELCPIQEHPSTLGERVFSLIRGWFPMTATTKDQIAKELARLRMWRDVASDWESARETEAAHDRINGLLDQLDAETIGRFRVPQ